MLSSPLPALASPIPAPASPLPAPASPLPAPASPLTAPASPLPAAPWLLYPTPNYIFIDTLGDAEHHLASIVDGDVVGLDLESCDNPNRPKLSKQQKREKYKDQIRDAATFTADWGEVEVCVAQIATVGGATYVIHLTSIAALPAEFVRICESPHILKVAAGIYSDGQRLWDNFRLNLYGAVSLGLAAVLAYPEDLNRNLHYGNEPGLANIVKHVLNYDLGKELQVSQWNAIPLSQAQRDYAAADVHSSLASYLAIQEELQDCGFVVDPAWYRFNVVKRVRVKEGSLTGEAWKAQCPWWSDDGIYMGRR
ncbi:ribonuclease H-like domain-containing protein [Mycena olivaceomarginata]|nr:ribonuclease H-like domain-containing protein [Mycena olivaceomarginata]KAJ7791933.1 ribonuclease H-like domain-containing protein [Mycena olivaceomarginata]KAJ7820993.1 ribonuclease H-like domain-containing protein [Mycena olivaceomarginata]